MHTRANVCHVALVTHSINCLGSIDHTNCVRSCMSAACYDLIYAFDELEPGEVDVRYNSFKGCFTKERSGSDVIALNNDANADRKGSFMSQMK